MRYFAYGSNLLDEELKSNNIAFGRIGPAFLHGWLLEFTRYSCKRNGGVADVVRHIDATDKSLGVWGYVYDIGESSLPNLDRKEGVSAGAYRRINVDAEMKNTKELRQCLTYEVVNKSLQGILPSRTYLDLIIQGAVEKCLPAEWIQCLKTIKSSHESDIEA